MVDQESGIMCTVYTCYTCSLLLLLEARVGGHGYSSPLVCLFVTGESTHLGVIALRLQHR